VLFRSCAIAALSSRSWRGAACNCRTRRKGLCCALQARHAEAMSQQRLFEFRMGERSPETLVVTDANRDAARLITDWRAWPGGALALIGPRGSGKTHLALAWALEAGARQISPRAAPEDAAAIFREA